MDTLDNVKGTPDDIIPLQHFLLKCDSECLVKLHAAKAARMKRLRAAQAAKLAQDKLAKSLRRRILGKKKATPAKAKPKAKAKVTKTSTGNAAKPAKKVLGKQGVVDHWKIQRL